MNNDQPVIYQDEEVSLHYPFTRQKTTILGDLGTALARIKQNRSGKPHVTGTLPLDVSPDSEDAEPEVTINQPATPGPVTAARASAAPAEKADVSDEDKEAYRKRRKKERRLARKAKKKALAEANGSTTPEEAPGESDDPEDTEPDTAISDCADEPEEGSTQPSPADDDLEI